MLVCVCVNLMAILKYRDNDLGLWTSSYPYILGRAVNHYKIKPTVFTCIVQQFHPIPLFGVIEYNKPFQLSLRYVNMPETITLCISCPH